LTHEVRTDILIPIMTSRVGERGQITIEKSIREELAIYAGDDTVQRVEEGRIVIEIVPGPHRRSLAGMLAGKVGVVPEDESWAALRAAAWEAPDPDWPALYDGGAEESSTVTRGPT
jgi:AbrB family looped-hinge helix DNA binding protein